MDAIQAAAPHAKVHAHGADQPDFAFVPVADGANLRGLRILDTPGHTAGHLSLLVNDGTLLAGDLVGTAFGKLTPEIEQPFEAVAALIAE